MKILITSNSVFSIVNYRLDLIISIKNLGHEVHLLTPEIENENFLREKGFILHNLPLWRTSVNILKEGKTFFSMFKKINDLKPDIILSFTIKNNLYGSIISMFFKIPFIPNITGLGNLFYEPNLLAFIIKKILVISFKNCPVVFCQNPDDGNYYKKGIVKPSRVTVLPGSGIDLSKFYPNEKFLNHKELKFIMISRLLINKGIYEYLYAAREIKKKLPKHRFYLLGPKDTIGKSSLSDDQLNEIRNEGIIEYLGETKNVIEFISEADCIILPSYYREGTPRVLIEAASMGKPIITTNVPGCKEVVIDNKNGFLCKPRDKENLKDIIMTFINLDLLKIKEMGKESRNLAEKKYDQNLIIEIYKKYIDNINDKKNI